MQYAIATEYKLQEINVSFWNLTVSIMVSSRLKMKKRLNTERFNFYCN